MMHFLTTSGPATVLAVISVLLSSCRNTPSPHSISSADSLEIINQTLTHRAEADDFFQHDPNSPFNRDTTVHFEGITWFPADVRFSFRSKLHPYEKPETVIVLGTKGEARKQLKYGYFDIPFDGRNNRINAYKFVPDEARAGGVSPLHLSVWFTDQTTGKETYEVGRYVDVGDEQTDPDQLYTINLNNAYNPYCAYSAIYSCAIPRKEDHFDFAVRAGEMKYHR